MECAYCELFTGSKAVVHDKDKGTTTRLCRRTLKMVSTRDPVCDNPSYADLFWCNKSDHWLDLKVCLARYGKGTPECKNCSQRKDIILIIRAKNRSVPTKLFRED